MSDQPPPLPDDFRAHMLSAVEGILGVISHMVQTIPAAMGAQPMLSAITMRLRSARDIVSPPPPPPGPVAEGVAQGQSEPPPPHDPPLA